MKNATANQKMQVQNQKHNKDKNIARIVEKKHNNKPKTTSKNVNMQQQYQKSQL